MGIVAVGDSIVAAEESWATWLSRAMGQPLRNLAVGGSLSDDVVGQVVALAEGEYAVACLSVGTNDILFDWDAERFARQRGDDRGGSRDERREGGSADDPSLGWRGFRARALSSGGEPSRRTRCSSGPGRWCSQAATCADRAR